MEIKTINYKVFSYCGDFDKSIVKGLQEYPPNCYIEYTANSKKELERKGYSNDLIANRLIELGCKENEKVLIEIDY